MEKKVTSTVYIDESGDLGYMRGTQWFVLSAAIVDKEKEPAFRQTFESIKKQLNLNCLHMCEIRDYFKKCYLVKKVAPLDFVYVNVIVDTTKLSIGKKSALLSYNYVCRLLLERVSWFLRDTKRYADVILSARGTSRDQELIDYITEKLIPNPNIKIDKNVFHKISAKPANSWDLLQLADICATSTFLYHEIKPAIGLRIPCFANTLSSHLYKRKDNFENYGIKYLDNTMQPNSEDFFNATMCK